MFFFFKQKTAYEMRISDWSSDVCSSDLVAEGGELVWEEMGQGLRTADSQAHGDIVLARKDAPASYHLASTLDDAAMGVTHVIRGADLVASTDVHRDRKSVV